MKNTFWRKRWGGGGGGEGEKGSAGEEEDEVDNWDDKKSEREVEGEKEKGNEKKRSKKKGNQKFKKLRKQKRWRFNESIHISSKKASNSDFIMQYTQLFQSRKLHCQDKFKLQEHWMINYRDEWI